MVIFPGQNGRWAATSDTALLLEQIDGALYSLASNEDVNPGRDMCGSARLDAISAFAESVRDVPTRRKMIIGHRSSAIG